MAEPPHFPDRGEDVRESSDTESTRGQSLWTKALIVLLGLLVVLAIVLHLVLGGGPRH